MADFSLRSGLVGALVKARALLALLGMVVGTAIVVFAMLQTTGPTQSVLNSIGGSLLGASLLTMFAAYTLPAEVLRLVRQDEFREALRGAFAQAHNIQEDGAKLGVSRIFASSDAVRAALPLASLVEGADEVYFLGTSLSTTVRLQGLVKNNATTKFRFIYVEIPDGPLLRALEIVHDVLLRAKLDATSVELSTLRSKHSNVAVQTIKCVPPFSALLALGRSEVGGSWGRLQVDHYLLRTPCDERLWLYLDDLDSPLFKRYRALVEDMWQHPDRSGTDTAHIGSQPALPPARSQSGA